MAILGKSKIEELEVGHGQSSTTPTTGAEIVHGGLGVEENLHVGGNFSAGNVEQTLTDDPNKIPSSAAVFEGTIKTVTASAEKVDTDAPAEVEVTTEDRNSNLHFKIPSGNDGKTLLLQADSLFFRADSLGTIVDNQTITLKVQSSNLNEQITWDDPSIPAGTTEYPISVTSGSASYSKSFTVTADGLSSTLTIGTINEGDSPYVLVPSTDNFVFSADPEGNVPAKELTTIGSFQILYGSKTEDLSDWSISSTFQPTANFSGTVSAEGQISVSKFSPASDIGYITITATKGGNTVSRTLRCVKAKSGETPITLALENDNYVFTFKGGTTPELDDVLPAAISAFRILIGNEEQTFTVGTNASGWGVSAVFTAVVDGSSSTDASLFNGDIQADGVIRVTAFSPTLQYGKIVLTATHPTLGTLNATVSVRAQKSAGFGTPVVTTTTLQMGENATVSITPDAGSTESAKVFNFQFGIPRGKDPVYLEVSPDSIAYPFNSTGSAPETSATFTNTAKAIVYDGGVDVSKDWSFSLEGNGTSSVACSIDASSGNISIASYEKIDVESHTITVKATGKSGTSYAGMTLTSHFRVYKSRSGEKGDRPAIAAVNVNVDTTPKKTPSATATITENEANSGIYTITFNFVGLADRAYLPIGTIFAYAGKNTPEGAVELAGGTVDGNVYTDFYNWAVANAPTVTSSEYNTQKTNNGSCGYFVIDTSTKQVTVPLIRTFLEGGDSSNVGQFKTDSGRKFTASFTLDGLGNYSGQAADGIASVAQNTGVAGTAYNNVNANGVKISLDSSKAWPGENNGTEFRPKSIKYRYFIQVYQSVSADLSSIELESLASKFEEAIGKITDLQNQINAIKSSLSTGNLTVSGTLTL